ncbi:multiple sugar transport system substrate-binding protein [Crossiella equi]|uniref:Multiple sugar transport system substrate-binding protein n=1 Tax=Crossiella equi TaxID=130796 RepID=A0ABS5ASL1_9PSEU|nr:sugar ABC transporter substrate-binding protein [Crossiella equi]MBP2479554.1 multiple sugar transport system substrate-binding protein [Crossiella equi]
MRSTRLRAAAALLCLATVVPATACGAGGGGGAVTLGYWLWDDKQLPAYQECADAFQQANPGVSVKITQTAWGQYWQNLTTQLAAGQAPDVWTNQNSYYPQFATRNQLLDLEPLVKRDNLDLTAYRPGLADVWVKDGKRYGLPKDWDTMALVYNSAMLAERGVGPAELAGLTWNPADGGTLERVIAKATVDEQGRDGLDPAFDKNRVRVHGFLPEWADGAQGQNGWGILAAANGFHYLDKNPWGTRYRYDDPKLAETIAWYQRLIDKGYAPRLDQQSTVANSELLTAGKGAIMVAGSWTILTFTAPELKQRFTFAPLPTGPAGRRGPVNGLADAVWAGTEHPEQAWNWVKYLASADCQDRVARHAVVFPARTGSSRQAVAAHQAQGRDVHVFTDVAEQETFLLPVTDHATEIGPLVQDAIQSAVLGRQSPQAALAEANEKVNALFR